MEDPFIINLAKTSVARGVKCTVILPFSELTQDLEEDIKKPFLAHPEQLTVKRISPQLFQSLVVTRFLILNPDGCGDYLLRVFLELPIKEPSYWIEVSSGTAFKLSERFQVMLQQENPA